MDTTKILADLKKRPGFTENVGMVLVHNGVVRGWARADHAPVKSMKVSHDRAKMDAICRELEKQPGIFCIHAEAEEGDFQCHDVGSSCDGRQAASGSLLRHPRTRQGDLRGAARPHQGRGRDQAGIHRIADIPARKARSRGSPPDRALRAETLLPAVRPHRHEQEKRYSPSASRYARPPADRGRLPRAP